ncbi:MAG: hypothetical protein GY941_23120, partial [Planctomycetes bacterium]|nr:hypothetical protein [Planctomycetota bacterium]
GEQAYDALTADPEFSITRERAFEILEKLERKHLKRRKRHEIELSDELPDDRTLTPDEILIGDEELSYEKQLSYIINDIRGSFSAEDSLVLRMRFEDGINISEIARGLNVERSYIDKKVKMMLKKFKDEILKRKQ